MTRITSRAPAALLLCAMVLVGLVPPLAQGQVFVLTVDVTLDEPTVLEINASAAPESVTLNGTVEVSAKPPNVSATVTLQTSSTTGWSVTTEPSTMSFSTVGMHPFSVIVLLPHDLNGTSQSGITITAVAKAAGLQSTDQVSASLVITRPPPPTHPPDVPQRIAQAQRGSLVIIIAVLLLVVGGGAALVLLGRPTVGSMFTKVRDAPKRARRAVRGMAAQRRRGRRD